MLENVTNLINATNLTFATYNVLLLILKCWVFLIAIGIPTGVTTMVKYLASSFRDITLIHQDADTLTCAYPYKPIWRQHCFARIIVWIFTPWRKYNNIVENWNKKYNDVNTEISLKVEEILDRNIVTENDSSEFMSDKNSITKTIYDTISENLTGDSQGSKLKIEEYGYKNGQLYNHVFRIGGRTTAQSSSYEKLKKLEDLFLIILEDDKIKNSILRVESITPKKDEVKQVFSRKLAKLVFDVRTWDGVLSLRDKYDYDNNLK